MITANKTNKMESQIYDQKGAEVKEVHTYISQCQNVNKSTEDWNVKERIQRKWELIVWGAREQGPMRCVIFYGDGT